jgi:hypothetical protein
MKGTENKIYWGPSVAQRLEVGVVSHTA